jgi:hypothetical protein
MRVLKIEIIFTLCLTIFCLILGIYHYFKTGSYENLPIMVIGIVACFLMYITND